jgi:acyl-coenzyme A synthetase/AMP-(fatty) acid ligase
MLYERWRRVVEQNRAAVALCDLATGERWTFGELDAAAGKTPPTAGPVAFPQGISIGFVLEVLRAWKDGRPVCPLEAGQTPARFAAVPAGCVHLKSTSATTGASKLIAFTAEQLLADVTNIVQTMGLRPDWPNLGVISLAHSYGFSNLVLPLLLCGIPLVLLESSLPEAVRRAATGFGPLTLPAVPALWRAWHDAGALASSVRLAISAGAPLPLPLEQAVFDASGIKIHNFYGASECGGIAYDSTAIPRTDGACVGSPMRNVQLSVHAGEGCLEVRSRAVGLTYWPNSHPNLTSGCYRTNDLAELKDGAVFLRGRAGDLINVAGRKVSPEIIERALLMHPQLRECLVFGVPSSGKERSESIVACVVASGAATAETLRRFLLERLPAWQVPREWVFVDSLATNTRGKFSRAEWRQRHLGQGR